ncbi:5775_t:CDS:10 [Dentiscutata erythropus]|uniref:5775_t:CDS:1 n=1 Tax=Dentiscutata erythropus TaxID=1348616 RepID=A0A9N9APT3_9GLOM|nr:5775_t:CDS:10 [Dentiscutata erythropus]
MIAYKIRSRVILVLIYVLAFENVVLSEYRTLNGTNNDKDTIGVVNMPFVRQQVPLTYFQDNVAIMVSTPGNYTTLTTAVSCADRLPAGNLPLPRCVSNVLHSYRLKANDVFNLTYLEQFKSKRSISHIVSVGPENGQNFPQGIYIPTDDSTYQSNYIVGPNVTMNQPYLAFNRSQGSGNVGINAGTPFLDGSHLYGVTDAQTSLIRDTDTGSRGKMRLVTSNQTEDGKLGYPPKDANGEYIFGLTSLKGRNVFTDDVMNYMRFMVTLGMMKLIFKKQEDGILLGTPLPVYKSYNADLKPAVDTFFATTSMRYGHSEVSDNYAIVDDKGHFITTLQLNSLQQPHLLELYGIPNLVVSMALQMQEEVDIYISDQMRYYLFKSELMDIASLDCMRGRDHGIPKYNDARQYFGLTRAQDWSDISSDPAVQSRLRNVYGTVDQVESFVGGLAEDHVPGSNLGPLFYHSYINQWTNIRDFDRFWYESPGGGFTSDEINTIHNTTLAMVINRNIPSTYSTPTNLWVVQPVVAPNATAPNSSYSPFNILKFSNTYQVQWRIDGSDLYLFMTMQSANAWFGIGFNSLDGGMLFADMIIVTVNSSMIDVGLYMPTAYQKPDRDLNSTFLTVLGKNVTNGYTQVEVKRPLNAPNRKPITNSLTTTIYAFNPSVSILTYHGGNRGSMSVNFFTASTAGSLTEQSRKMQLAHGTGMFTIWCVLFPVSIWIVRYMRHRDSHMFQHRNLQIVGAFCVGIFGAVAMSSVTVQFRVPHGILGTSIYTGLIVQVALGLLAIFGLAHVESAFLLAMIFLASEFYYKIKNLQFLWPTRMMNDTNLRIHRRIPEKVYELLPAYTWSEFNEKVLSGACLVVAEGLVFDIHSWIKIHPGGQKILRRVIGTDITNDFFFDPNVQMVISRNFDKEHELLQSNTIDTTEYPTVQLKHNKPSSGVPSSIARSIDILNSVTFKNTRVAMHRHSKFATAKLATMVIARISGYDDENVSRPAVDGILPYLTPSKSRISPDIFRRYILTNIEDVTRYDAENPVKKFTFQVIHPYEKLPEILPGDYIEVMSYTNKTTIVRPYTLLKGPSNTTFSIIVKIYKDGVMSQHLGKQLRNFEIAVRGPFDVSERIEQVELPSSSEAGLRRRLRASIMSTSGHSSSRRYTKSNTAYSRYGSVSSDDNNYRAPSSRILLNSAREDKCWDYLFLVCGGTGITPALQLIQYHLEQKDSKFHIHLITANHSIADIISLKYLLYLQDNSEGKFTVEFILSRAPPTWKGYVGTIDDNLLYEWISKNYQPLQPPKIPERPNIMQLLPNQSLTHIQTDEIYVDDSINQSDDYILTMSPTSIDQPGSPLSVSSTATPIPDLKIPIYPPTNAMILLNERHEFMKLLANDTIHQLRVIVCGPPAMMENIRIALNKIGFPDEKAIFII